MPTFCVRYFVSALIFLGSSGNAQAQIGIWGSTQSVDIFGYVELRNAIDGSGNLITNYGYGSLTVESDGSLIIYANSLSGLGPVTLKGGSTTAGALLEVRAGSSFYASDMTIGSNIQSNTGAAIFRVTGINAYANTSGTVTVGIGNSVLSRGRVEVNTNGRWDYLTTIIGDGGRGDLVIASGGDVIGSSFTVANLSTSLGIVNLTGSGSTLSATSLIVGKGGDGRMSIASGASVTTSGTVIGKDAFSIGSITISGTGSSFSTSFLTIGDAGWGTLDLGVGTTASWTSLTIGQQSGSSGLLYIPVNSSLNLMSNPIIGGSGSGSISFRTSGATSTSVVTSSGTLFMGKFAGSQSDISVPVNGELRAEDLQVGLEGSANLFISGKVAVSDDLFVSGDNFTSAATGTSGYVSVSGSSGILTVNGNTYVGKRGTGLLEITSGGQVTSSRAAVIADGLKSSTQRSKVTVNGFNSRWTILGDGSQGGLTVGTATYGDRADVYISGGGRISIESGDVVINSPSTLGAATINVDEEDSLLELKGSTFAALRIGDRSGYGKLLVSAGGAVKSAAGYIGGSSGTIGFVDVSGSGSVWTINDNVLAGYGILEIGQFSTAQGTLQVGTGGLVDVYGPLGVARSGGTGTIEINGGTVAITPATDVALYTGPGALVQINGGGSITSTKDAYLAGGAFNLNFGNMTFRKLTIPSGATVSLSGNSSAQVILTGAMDSVISGKLKLANVSGGTTTPSSSYINLTSPGVLKLSGTLEKVFTTGYLSNGTPYIISGSLFVTGSGVVDVTGATIKFSSVSPTSPWFDATSSSSYLVISTETNVRLTGVGSATFDPTDFPASYAGTFSLYSINDDLYVRYTYTPVPEPAHALGFVAVAFGLYRRLRRKIEMSIS